MREVHDVATLRRALLQDRPAAFVLDVQLADGVEALLVPSDERLTFP